MNSFKVRFLPIGIKEFDIEDGNTDIHLILPDGSVFFAVLFTIKNINTLMNNEGSTYFWADDMIILRDLKDETIQDCIRAIIREQFLEKSFAKIGKIGDPNVTYEDYESIEDGLFKP